MKIKKEILGLITKGFEHASSLPVLKNTHGIDRLSRIFAQHQDIDSAEETAYHEAGHALLQYLLFPDHPPKKITIIPAQGQMGYMKSNDKNPYTGKRHEYINDMITDFGGYCAEKILYGETTEGCSQDLQNIKKTAHDMIRLWNMGGINVPYAGFDMNTSKIKVLGLPIWTRTTSTDKPFSPEMQAAIDKAETELITRAQRTAYQLLLENKPALDALAQALRQKRTLIEPEIKQIIETNTEQRPDIRIDYPLALDEI